MGLLTIVLLPIRHPILRKIVFESSVPADILKGRLHQAKKQS
jgi:hypothetical protein